MRIEMTKEKTILYLDTATVQALTDYARRHARRVRSKSDAADQLLQRALTGDMDEGTERILAPMIAEIVRETARREILDQIAPLLDRQSNRLAALLVQSGKDAHRAARIVETVLAEVTGDAQGAARLSEEARLRAGAQYSRRGLDATSVQGKHGQ